MTFYIPGRNKENSKKSVILDLKLASFDPSLVDIEDANSPCPIQNIKIKSSRYSTPFPSAWRLNSKTKLNSGRYDRKEYVLPPNVAATGIQQLKKISLSLEELNKIKRAKIQTLNPIMGRINIDYKILHDAFFQFEYLPKFSGFGEIGGNSDTKTKNNATYPSKISDTLKRALNQSGPLKPMPWINRMQKLGTPPAFIDPEIPGVTAPIPLGADTKDWGSLPVDEFGRHSLFLKGNKRWDLLEKKGVDIEQEKIIQKELDGLFNFDIIEWIDTKEAFEDYL
eukprot:GAHX01001343.1.p1 GENE.GAHX01001343.1~~GAHX01001343.1.p1  ORF type:complete len:281 (-),score=49.89 GAHX01001343.1:312-1154(-)